MSLAQLPPTLASSPVYRSEEAEAAGGHTLERTLFERLAHIGMLHCLLTMSHVCNIHSVFLLAFVQLLAYCSILKAYSLYSRDVPYEAV